MALTSNPYFDELSAKYGVYYAVNKIASEANAECNRLSNTISTATAIDYIANGKKINAEDFPDHRLDFAREYLNYLIDGEIRDAVLLSFQLSLRYDNLVYKYMAISDELRRGKVKRLTKIVWDMYKSKHKY